MALIDCPECRKPVSSEARACPGCGYPVVEKLKPATGPGATASGPREPIAIIHPSWWGYFWYWFFFFLIVPPFIAWVKRSATVLRIYRDRITIERGLFSKGYQDYHPKDIRSIDVDQTFFGRVLGIGDITLSTAASSEGTEILLSIPNPQAVRELILAQRGNQ
jgi:uncharacterized membrane protein YdbT with pleckstrin-like domain